MILTIDPITRKKLFLVKQLYEHALIQSQSVDNSTNRIFSIIGFDLAIETILKTILVAIDTKKYQEYKFHDLVRQVDTLLKESSLQGVPDQNHIIHIHEIRNNAQHKAIFPNENAVNDCRTYCRDFLNTITLLVFGDHFQSINLVDLLQDDEIRQILATASQKVKQKSYSEAVDLASQAMTKTIEYVKSAVVGTIPSHISGIVVSDSFRSGKDDQKIYHPDSHHNEEALLRALEKMQETLMFVVLGLNQNDYLKYKKIAGYTYFTADNKHHRFQGKDDPNENDAEFVVSYCIDAIVKIEEHIGSLKKPFGKSTYEASHYPL